MPLMTLELPDDLAFRIEEEAKRLGMTLQERAIELLEPAVAPAENFQPGAMAEGLARLNSFVNQIPGVGWVSVSPPDQPLWWVKFSIALDSPLAWSVVQYLGYVLNYLSIEERLPTVFMPISPPPDLNGGPEDYLSWVIEASIPFVDPGVIAAILAKRLPRPVADAASWETPEDSQDEDNGDQ